MFHKAVQPVSIKKLSRRYSRNGRRKKSDLVEGGETDGPESPANQRIRRRKPSVKGWCGVIYLYTKMILVTEQTSQKTPSNKILLTKNEIKKSI